MPKSAYKHPSVFVACPYTPKTTFEAFRRALNQVPLEFHYADSAIKTKHVLQRIRQGIVRCDYALFDITGWNSNVTLELGLAEGLNEPYYILFKSGAGKKKNPPTDIEGLQRFQYSKVDGFTDDCLTFQINQKLVRTLTHPRFVYDELSGKKRERKFIVAMRVLAHFKAQKYLDAHDIGPLVKGSYLRDPDIQQILEILNRRKLIKGKLTGSRFRAGRSLYRRVTF